ncbi:glutaredoxin domain-containing protein [Clostridium botulinum]|uniref:glutaredoxin domain-containing protein n=1 Tax=Clostridium botulinum TaxID=1491 RepID=UPI0004D6FA54|nr:glutaredoxin domain-containing protein [Clostridium botulinum]KEH99773.1 putative glutaredoxin [Clostridium botulinum C/D str. BKT75002]KEI05251.1 putative glutaredoxin [Clostridium botulinum C/D str. BKT2873]QPW62139.1 glutaredoxin [Clostridium botulinum]
MIKVIGNEGCTSCQMVKYLLDKKNIEYTYVSLSSLNEDERVSIVKQAQLNNMVDLPFIFKNGKQVEKSEIL